MPKPTEKDEAKPAPKGATFEQVAKPYASIRCVKCEQYATYVAEGLCRSCWEAR